VALKLVPKKGRTGPHKVRVTHNEIRMLKQVDHPFLVQFLAYFQDARRVGLLLEFVSGGDLRRRMLTTGPMRAAETRFYMGEVALALEYLHSHYIVYRDLKPENLLIDWEGHIKLTDFGFAKRVVFSAWTLCGTPQYFSPEIVLGNGYGHEVDWWALGVITFELMAGHSPWKCKNPAGIFKRVLKMAIAFPDHFEPSTRDFIQQLLERRRAERLGCPRKGLGEAAAVQVMGHAWWFQGDGPDAAAWDWEALLARAATPPYRPAVWGPEDVSATPQEEYLGSYAEDEEEAEDSLNGLCLTGRY
jgi:serine/threonine protein kinase